MARLWYLNGDFDIELSQVRAPHLSSMVAEMTAWFVALGAFLDRVILDVTPHTGYFDYLRWAGLTPAQPVQPGQQLPNHLGEPWGLCASAKKRLRTYGVKLNQPQLDVVRQVNSREFGYQISHAALHRPQFLVCEASRLLLDQVGLSEAVVIKQMHTNAGRDLTHQRIWILVCETARIDFSAGPAGKIGLFGSLEETPCLMFPVDLNSPKRELSKIFRIIEPW